MATTIKLKNGSGAPASSDLVQGEPALDLTNKRLYSENSGGTVVEIGSNPSALSIAGTPVTSTAAELNILDGVTSTAAELNILDGKAFLDEDNMASNSATGIASQQSIKAYVDAQQDTVDTLAEVLALSNTSGGTDISVSTDDKVQFRDSAIYINSSTDGQLDIVADTEIQIAATTVDLNGNLDVSGSVTSAGLQSTTAGTSNFIAGVNAGNSLESGGNSNTVVGDEAGTALTTGDNNVAVGYLALEADTLGARNVAVGYGALKTQNFTSATNVYNTAVGFNGGVSLTTGKQNSLLGGRAGDALTTGNSNVGVGYDALTKNTAGHRNVAIGESALGTFNATTSTNGYNTAVGYGAGEDINTGVKNTLLGGLAGSDITSGGENIVIGKDAGLTGSPGGVITTASNILSLGDENVTTANIQIDWTVASDARDKTDFTALDLGLDFVKDLKPVTYKWDKRSKYGDKTAEGYDLNAQTPDGTYKEDWLDIGFKAQEVEALEIAAGYTKDNKTNLVSSHTEDGKQMGLQYSKFVPILVKAIQEQQALIESLTARLETLEG